MLSSVLVKYRASSNSLDPEALNKWEYFIFLRQLKQITDHLDLKKKKKTWYWQLFSSSYFAQAAYC